MSNLSGKLTWITGLLATVWLVGGTGCLESDGGGLLDCEADVAAKVEALQVASDALVSSAHHLAYARPIHVV